jgi:hypothetical protein
MKGDVVQAQAAWRAAREAIDELVDQFGEAQPVDPVEWSLREEREFDVRRAYYALVREQYGLPDPAGFRS